MIEQFHRTVTSVATTPHEPYLAYIDLDGQPVYRHRHIDHLVTLACGHTQTWSGQGAETWVGRADVYCYDCSRNWEQVEVEYHLHRCSHCDYEHRCYSVDCDEDQGIICDRCWAEQNAQYDEDTVLAF